MSRKTAELTPAGRYRWVLQHATDVIFEIDPGNDRIVEASAAACRCVGYSRAELIAGVALSAVLISGAPELALAGAVPAGHEPAMRPVACRTRAGLVMAMQAFAERLEVDGESRLLILLRAAAAVEPLPGRPTDAPHTNSELRALARTLGHEMTAPLRAIDGFARILADEQGANLGSDGQRMLALVLSNAKRMRGLVDGLVHFMELGAAECRPEPLDMADQVEGAVCRLQQSGLEHRAKITVQALPAAYGDPTLVFRVWMSLLQNAVKFSAKSPAPAIEIGSMALDGNDVYYVKDNGAGFDRRYADKLFGLFQRLHSIDDFEGSGVGLAMAKRIVEQHGGRIWADAQPGHGATFFFTLPPGGASLEHSKVSE